MDPLPASPIDGAGLGAGQLLRVLWWRRWIAAGVLGTIVAATLAASLLAGPTYRATATVLVDAKRSDPILGPMAPTLVPAGFMATQVDIINSPRVVFRAVRELKLDTNPLARQIWQDEGKGRGTIEQFFAERLQRGLEARPSRESNVISIVFSGADPAFAATVANAVAKAYVETSVELLADPARTSAHWFDERVKQLRDELEAAQTRLSEYQQQHQVLATDERLDMETSRLNELNTQLTTIQAQRAESASRDREARGRLAASPDVLQNPVIQSLRGDIARAEGKHTELAAQLGPNHPQLKRSQAELDTLKAKLDAEMRQVASGVSTSNLVNEQREGQARAALDAQKKHVLDLRTQHAELSVLQREVDNAQKAYDLAAQRLSQTSLESQAQQTNIQLLSEALPPTSKSSPHTMLNLVVASFFGTILAVGAALGREYSDRRLRRVDDAARVYGLPVLAQLSGRDGRPRTSPFPRPFLRGPARRLSPGAAG